MFSYVLITPARDEEAFIGRTLESVVSQTKLPVRWVIVDDGSADRTPEIVSKFAERHPHGIKFKCTGKGATLLVTEIDGIANQGGSGDEMNWIYSVNEKKGNKSCGVRELQAGDVVLWKFDLFDG